MKERHKAIAGWLMFAVPLIAYAAGEVTRTLDGSFRFWMAEVAVLTLALVGYGASSLKDWACWRDGTTVQRLEVVQSMIVSVLAGHITYYGGYYYAFSLDIRIPEIGCFIGTALGGYGGAKYVTVLVDACITSAVSILSRLKANGEAK